MLDSAHQRIRYAYSHALRQAFICLLLTSFDVLTMKDKVRSSANNLLRTCCNTASSNWQTHLCASISPYDTGFLHFPFSKFRHCYLSLQSPVSSFPRGTCLLLDSNICSALDEIYHPLHAPIPRNMTLRRHTVHRELQMTHRIITLINAFSKGLLLHLN